MGANRTSEMEKELRRWSPRHLLAISVALNVSLVLRLAYNEREIGLKAENDVVCVVPSSYSPAETTSLSFAASVGADDGDEDRIVNLDQ